MDTKVLKTYEFHLKNNRIYLIKKVSLVKAIRSLKNDYNLNLLDISKVYSNSKKVPYIYLRKVVNKFAEKED